MNNDLLNQLLIYPHVNFQNGNYKNKNDVCIIWPFFDNGVFKKIIYKSFDYTTKGIPKNIIEIFVIDNKNTMSLTCLQDIYDNYKNNLQESLDNYIRVNKLVKELTTQLGKYNSFLGHEYHWIFNNGSKIIIHQYLNPNLETIQLHFNNDSPSLGEGSPSLGEESTSLGNITYINSDKLFLFLDSIDNSIIIKNTSKQIENHSSKTTVAFDRNNESNKLIHFTKSGERTIKRDELIKNYKNLFLSMSVPKHKRILAQSCKIDNPYKDLK